MTTLLYANNASTTLVSGINASVTTVTLTDASGFPSPGAGEAFMLTFIDTATKLVREIVQCTSRSGNVLTIVRGQEGTTARSWIAGDIAAQLWTAGSASALAQVYQIQAQLGNYAVDTGAANAYVAAFSPVVSTRITGAPFRVKIVHANTGASTLNIGFGATAIKDSNGQDPVANDLLAGAIYEFIDNGTNFQFTKVDASTTVNGVVKLASGAEAVTGTDAKKAVTPLALSSVVSSILSTVAGIYETIAHAAATYMPIAGGTFSGTVNVPTIAGSTDNTNKAAPTSFVQNVATALAAAVAAVYAPLNSPTFTGTPAGPTAAPGTNTTQFATTAFCTAAIAALSIGGRLLQVDVYPTPGSYTWTRPSGCNYAIGRATAGGGGGAGVSASGQICLGAPGGAGGTQEGYKSAPSASYSVTVGAGGAKGTGLAAGTAGGLSSIGFLTGAAAGGVGGATTTAVSSRNGIAVRGGLGGTLSGSASNILSAYGGSGGPGFAITDSGLSFAGAGNGGNSIYGGGGAGGVINHGAAPGYQNGQDGQAPGAGGGGAAADYGSSVSGDGGNGANGLVIIWSFS